MAEEVSLNLSLKDSAAIFLKGVGLGGVSGGVVGGVGHYLLGFRQVTPLTGVVTGTIFGGLYI